MLRQTLAHVGLILLAAAIVALPSCSGGSSGSPAPALGQGTVVVTDAPLDDIELFEVDVTGLVFHRVSGNDVSALPAVPRVNFAELENLGELVSRVSLPAGLYTGVTMTLDFGSAMVVLKDQTTPATVKDGEGAVLTGELPVSVNFAMRDRPLVVANRRHVFLLDLDLNQSLTVNGPANEVMFEPALSAKMDPNDPRPIRVRGILKSVDTMQNTFVIENRSFRSGIIGEWTVTSNANTVYQISGVVQMGNTGLGSLATLTTSPTWVHVQGSLDPVTRELSAAGVEAGTGTFLNGQDWMTGLIIGRDRGAGSDVSLTVLGRSRNSTTFSRTFNTVHTVNVAYSSTKVFKRAMANPLTTDALNVGQRIVAFGALSGTTLDATATTGAVRMVPTSFLGVARSAPMNDTLTLDVARIGLRPISRFDFTVAAIPEANPQNYTVDVLGINTTGITTNSRVRAIGYVNPVGINSDDDFRAVSLVNRTNEAKVMLCWWPMTSRAEITQVNAMGITLDVNDAGIKAVDDGFGPVVLASTPAPTIRPRGPLGIYRIIGGRAVELHFSFDAFATSLSARLTPMTHVRRVSGLGVFDTQTQVFDASILTIVLEPR